MKLHKSAHTVYKTQYHIVWITRYQRKILVTGVKSYLKIKLQEIRKYYPDWEYIEIGIKNDDSSVYDYSPKVYGEQGSRNDKLNTGKRLKIKFALRLKEVYWDDKGIWVRCCSVSTV